MKKILAAFLILTATASFAAASEYKDFSHDLSKPYSFYRKALAMTTKKDDTEKAKAAINSFVETYSKFSKKYIADPPANFAKDNSYQTSIKRAMDVANESLAYINAGNIGRAHTSLEEIRYIFWKMRVNGGVASLEDKANDFHEAMEVLFNQASASKEPEDLQRLYERYGRWFQIKWEDIKNGDDISKFQANFAPLFAEGKNAIEKYLSTLKKGDYAEAKKLSGAVKSAYKNIWMMNPSEK